MADHLTEEEQIDAIKRWWKENWLSLVAPIVIAIAGYVGWNTWQDHKLALAQEASDKYETLVALYEAPDFGESQRGQALLLAEEISSDYSSSLYADLSSLLAARISVEQNELDKAQDLLRGVVENGKTDAIVQLAQARLAKVLLALSQYEEALSLVLTPAHESATSLYAEIRGDIYLAQEQHSAARTAYQDALDSLLPDQASHSAIIQFKLRGVAQDDESSSPELASNSEEQTSEDEVDVQETESAATVPAQE